MRRLACMLDLWLFEELSMDERRQIEALTIKRAYRKGEALFTQGERASVVFLLTTGRVKLYKVSHEGKEVILGFLHPHDLLGEETLFRDSIRSFSAEAVEASTVCACSKDDFEAVAARFPSISAKITRALGRKLDQMADQLADMAMYEVRERVGRVLVRLARQYGEKAPEGVCLDHRITHDDLGALVGASRVMVTNVLADLRESGLISVDSQRRFVVRTALLDGTPQTDPPLTQPECGCFNKV